MPSIAQSTRPCILGAPRFTGSAQEAAKMMLCWRLQVFMQLLCWSPEGCCMPIWCSSSAASGAVLHYCDCRFTVFGAYGTSYVCSCDCGSCDCVCMTLQQVMKGTLEPCLYLWVPTMGAKAIGGVRVLEACCCVQNYIGNTQ